MAQPRIREFVTAPPPSTTATNIFVVERLEFLVFTTELLDDLHEILCGFLRPGGFLADDCGGAGGPRLPGGISLAARGCQGLPPL